MDYTSSNAFATDAGTGNRLHQQSAAIPTAVTDQDMNGIIWELLSVIRGAGLTPQAFDKTVPATYNQVYQAVQTLIASALAAGTNNDYKASVRLATTANIASLVGGAPNTLDGISLALNDRILVKDQATASQNGLYIASTLGTGANGTWARAADADGAGELTSGAIVAVEEGTANADSRWMLKTDGAITIGTTALTFEKQGGGASLVNIVRYGTAGSGTYNKPTNVVRLLVRCIGGGGSGAGGHGDYGASGGGGAGGFTERLITAPAASYAYTVGAGGAGVALSTAGNAGSNTTIAGMTASGGSGGIVGSGAGGVGGAASGGDLNVPGGGGSGGAPKAGNYADGGGGVGGSGFWGGGGAAGGRGDAPGKAGSMGGGGGGGAAMGASTGGAGGTGYIEIWEFI